jgi:preprotein translocase subunit YajC
MPACSKTEQIIAIVNAMLTELSPGDRVEGLGDFGVPTGEFGTVRQVNDDDAVVKWDDDGRIRVHQPSLKKL